MGSPAMGLAFAYTARKFGQGTRLIEVPNLAISSANPTQVFINNPNRVFWLVQNLTPYFGTLAFNDTLTVTTGIKLSGLGGYVSASVDEDGEVVTYPTWGIMSVAGQIWYTIEIVKA